MQNKFKSERDTLSHCLVNKDVLESSWFSLEDGSERSHFPSVRSARVTTAHPSCSLARFIVPKQSGGDLISHPILPIILAMQLFIPT